MKENKILKDEVISGIIKNEELRKQIADVTGSKLDSVRLLARNAQLTKKRNKLYDSEVLIIVKKFLKYKTINEMYK